MAEDVGQADDVVAGSIEFGGEKMAQVVGKIFSWVDMGTLGELFHFSPDLASGDGAAACGEEDFTAGDIFLPGVGEEFLAEAVGEEDDADFSFEDDFCFAAMGGFDGDVAEFGDADAAGADGFEDEGEAALALGMGGLDEAFVLVTIEFAAGVAEHAPLHFEVAGAAVVPAEPMKEAV